MGWCGLDRPGSRCGLLRGSWESDNEYSAFGKFLSDCTTDGLSSSVQLRRVS
jgi:hypothetical protein